MNRGGMRRALIIGVLCVLGGVAAIAQQPSSPLRFEVASVKPNNSGSVNSTTRTLPNGTFQVVNAHLKSMVGYGYDMRPIQILGGPDWVESDRFDVLAKTSEKEWDGGQMRSMVRALLADRFKLVAHTETREQPVYSLVLARRDGRLGSQLKPSTRDCSTGQGRPCGVNMTRDNRGAAMQAIAVSLADFAATLGSVVDRIVLDRTGVTGAFDLDLRFTMEGSPGGVAGDAPSIFAALQEQLELQLAAATGPVKVLVIDSVERPTPN